MVKTPESFIKICETSFSDGIPSEEISAPKGFLITPYQAYRIVWRSRMLSLKHVWDICADAQYYYICDAFLGSSEVRTYNTGIRIDGISGLIIPRKERHFNSGALYRSKDKGCSQVVMDLELIATLNSDQVDIVNDFIRTGTATSMSEAQSEYYLELTVEDGEQIRDQVVYGIIHKSDGTLIGLDATGDNASHCLVVGIYTTISNGNMNLSDRLLTEIKSIINHHNRINAPRANQ